MKYIVGAIDDIFKLKKRMTEIVKLPVVLIDHFISTSIINKLHPNQRDLRACFFWNHFKALGASLSFWQVYFPKDIKNKGCVWI